MSAVGQRLRLPGGFAALGLWLLAAACVPGPNTSPSAEPSHSTPPAPTSDRLAAVTLGSVSPTPKEEMAIFQPLADYLAQRLQSDAGARGRVVVAGSAAEMAALLTNGTVDLYIDSPFPMATVVAQSGARPFLRRWKNGVTDYRSVIFARADSGIRTLQDLRGKLIALKDLDSTSGYFLPKVGLLESGLRPAYYDDPSSPVPPDSVGYTFSRDEENAVFWVLRGKVAAAGADENALKTFAREDIGSLSVVYTSPSVPRHIVASRADLAPPLIERVGQILLAMDQDDEGRDVLREFQKTTKFDLLSEPAIEALRNLQGLVSQIAEDNGR